MLHSPISLYKEILQVMMNSLQHNTSFNDHELEGFFKTLWEKEKMLVNSIFLFSQNVFNPIKERNHQLRDDHFVLCRVLSVWSHKKILLSG